MIKEENDIYYQKEKFEHASRIINKEFNIRKNKLNIDEWKKYLTQTVIHAQDCQMVIVINTVSKNEGSIEEIYIDINEKAQRLDEENIFKGYCFSKIKDLNQQELLKYKWTCIKKNFYGIKELRFKDLSSLLQMFLMIKKETTNITKNLHYEGKHYLANKQPTDVMDLLDEINVFEESLLTFKKEIDLTSYKFQNITVVNRTCYEELPFIKQIAREILVTQQNLYKLPLFHFINYYMKCDKKVEYSIFVSFFRAYYVYMYIFTFLIKEKKRESSPIHIVKAINDQKKPLEALISEIKDTVDNKVKFMELNVTKSNIKMVYSMIDTLAIKNTKSSNKTILLKSYWDETEEHFVINRSLKVVWESKSGDFYQFDESDLYKGCKDKKEVIYNIILLPEINNREMENKDILEKIDYIQLKKLNKRKHVQVYLDYIVKLNTYQDLKKAKYDNWNRAEVLETYKNFLEEYFSTENMNQLNGMLYSSFKSNIHKL